MIAKAIVEAHGGKMAAHSVARFSDRRRLALGEGHQTTFLVALKRWTVGGSVEGAMKILFYR